MADRATTTRVATGMAAAAERKAQLGRSFTPPAIAAFVAGLFAAGMVDACHVLDAKPPGDEVPPATQRRPLKRASA